MPDAPLLRSAAASAIDGTGWRLLFKTLAGSVAVASSSDALVVAAIAVGACEDDADNHLRVDLRRGRVELTVQAAEFDGVSETDVMLAFRIEQALTAAGYELIHQAGGRERQVQAFEVAIDAADIPAVIPFWKAVLGYVDEHRAGAAPAIVDPAGQGPDIWFQLMDPPRVQRNRIHIDVTVAHDEAARRIDAALAAGGTLLSDAEARAFWVLADPEGNEVCVCTWQDRD